MEKKLMHLMREKAHSSELSIESLDSSTYQTPWEFRDQVNMQTYTFWHIQITYQGRQDVLLYHTTGTSDTLPDPFEVLRTYLDDDTIVGYDGNWGEWACELGVGQHRSENGLYTETDPREIYSVWQEQTAYHQRLLTLFGKDFDLFFSSDPNWDPNYDEEEEEEEKEEQGTDQRDRRTQSETTANELLNAFVLAYANSEGKTPDEIQISLFTIWLRTTHYLGIHPGSTTLPPTVHGSE